MYVSLESFCNKFYANVRSLDDFAEVVNLLFNRFCLKRSGHLKV